MINMLPQVDKLKETALNLLFPRRCVGCGAEGGFICDCCRQSLRLILPPVCPRCGRHRPSETLCSDCIGWQAEIDGIRSPFEFDGVMRQAIHELKYRNLRAIAEQLAKILHDYLVTESIPAEILVPVPLHKKRLRERGYNQSELLARELGKLVNIPVAGDYLLRRRQSSPQARTLNVEARYHNVTGAFVCVDHRFQGKQVLLIDDVCTSGATLDSCALSLKEAGVASVWGLVMAREI